MDDRLLELLLGNLGTLVLALLAILGFIRGWIVPGWAYRAIARDRERLFEIALPAVRGLEHGAQALKDQRRENGP